MVKHTNKKTNSLLTAIEAKRTSAFIGLQLFFLAISPFTGGFHKEVWSMLDSSILVLSIGITGLIYILENQSLRKTFFNIALILYILAVLDMSLNILLSGVLGWAG
ncbi:MAG: hypothetical protein JXA50_04250 [Deltaproteobacteria bacterium]|nr:hypothetical protein [Deltaproteobacteria bacterium]